jgi:hypothetical protein
MRPWPQTRERSRIYQAKVSLEKRLIIDPQGRFIFWWQLIAVTAFIYNLWVLCYRFSFDDIDQHNRAFWFVLDYGFADFIDVIDVFIGFRTAVVLAGVLQKCTS